MSSETKDILIDFGKKHDFQFPSLSEETLGSLTQLEMLKEQDLDMYDIFGFDDTVGVSREDISRYYDSLIDKLNP